MNIKSTLSAMTLGLAVLTGCESLDKSVVAGAGGAAANAGRGDRRAAVTAGATGAAVAATSMTNDSRSESASRKTAVSAQRSSVGDSTGTSSKTETSTVSVPAPKPTETVAEPKKKPVNIANISDDNEFFAALKKLGKTKDEAILERGARMKDDKLRIEFIGLYPDQVDDVVWWSFVDFHEVTDPNLAEILIDKMKKVGVSDGDRFFYLAKLLDSNARAKHIARAKENREKAAKDGVPMLEKFYIGMPVIDYVMISLEDKQEWTKWDKPYYDWLKYRVDKKTDIRGKDWETEWKINDLSFDAKSRYKYFKVKGTVDGLFEFVKKYLDKSAQRKDITINGNWWQFTDDEHELKVGLNDENGVLNIYGM